MTTKIKNVFQEILDKADSEKITNERKKTSLAWFQSKVTSLGRAVVPKDFFSDKKNILMVEKPQLGKIYHFRYNPKTKAKLPYYDIFPLCIMLKFTTGGFIGLNLHYLSPHHRAMFFARLIDIEKRGVDGDLRFKMTYDLLLSATKYRWFRACIKRYYYSHMTSKFLFINEIEWNVALFLPTERFVKENKVKVWEDSEQKVKKYD